MLFRSSAVWLASGAVVLSGVHIWLPPGIGSIISGVLEEPGAGVIAPPVDVPGWLLPLTGGVSAGCGADVPVSIAPPVEAPGWLLPGIIVLPVTVFVVMSAGLSDAMAEVSVLFSSAAKDICGINDISSVADNVYASCFFGSLILMNLPILILHSV